MHRIDSDGATVDNKFTEGNPALSIPATVVDASFMNDIQEELCKLPEALGITLVEGTQDQVYKAVLELYKRGGLAAPIIFTVPNNQASAADVTGVPTFLTTQVQAFEFLFSIYRKTDTQNVVEMGRVYAMWNAAAAAWYVTTDNVSSLDDGSGVVFTLLATGVPNEYKLQYTSTDFTGTSYTATLRITDIKVVRVS